MTSDRFEAARSRLYLRMHALALPLGLLRPMLSSDVRGLGTDGAALFLAPEWQRDTAGGDPDADDRALMHTLVHLLLGHPVGARNHAPQKWNFACDMVCRLVCEALLPELFLPCDGIGELRARFAAENGFPDAGSVYAEIEKAPLCGDPAAFALDDHALWQSAAAASARAGGGDAGGQWAQAASILRARSFGGGQRKGSGTPARQERMRLGAPRDFAYDRFLRRFTQPGEVVRPDPDGFSMPEYLWGLRELDGVPLIEPPEWTEERRIRELVIAIDTSASCSNALTRMFLERTRDLILARRLFFRRFRLWILQCDTRVHRADPISSMEEFACYLENLSITGFGGTDFRPAFDWIAERRARGELTRMKGLLYFTDGLGDYPAAAPDYAAAFVFLKYRYDDIDLPDWALKLVLDAPRPKGVDLHEH